MKNFKLTLRLTFVLCLLISCGLIWTQPNSAGNFYDCEIDRFNDFMDANSLYTTTFRSWYRNDPISCQTQCTNQCNQISDPIERQQCMNNIGSCMSACDSGRYNDFTSAQDNLISVGNRTCSYNPDQCAEARYRRDQCNLNRMAQWENPMYDENGNYDNTWLSHVFEEYNTCFAASGINQCE